MRTTACGAAAHRSVEAEVHAQVCYMCTRVCLCVLCVRVCVDIAVCGAAAHRSVEAEVHAQVCYSCRCVFCV